ncbi:MAG: hypothetical protein ACYDEY_00300 [Acidimicrobiales bacterium]
MDSEQQDEKVHEMHEMHENQDKAGNEEVGVRRLMTLRRATVAAGALVCIAGASVLGLWLTAGSGAASVIHSKTYTIGSVCPHQPGMPLPAAKLARCRKDVAEMDRFARLDVEGRLPWGIPKQPKPEILGPGQPVPAIPNFVEVMAPGYMANDVGLLRSELAAQYGINDFTSQGGGSTRTENLGYFAGGSEANGQGHGILEVSWANRYKPAGIIEHGNFINLHNGGQHLYVTKQPVGALTATSVAGGIITLKATDGAIYAFNVNTLTFARKSA